MAVLTEDLGGSDSLGPLVGALAARYEATMAVDTTAILIPILAR